MGVYDKLLFRHDMKMLTFATLFLLPYLLQEFSKTPLWQTYLKGC